MLTFHFTGVDGSMTESETLTSGMVGKEVRLVFDESWADLSKTAVFRAGETTRVVIDVADTVIIPAEVLERPFAKLYVGIYGTDAAGTIVIPTMMAEGPLIRYGADPIEDETAKELPVWQNLQNQIGNTALLETDAKEDLVSALNEVLAGQECIGDPAALHTAAKNTLVAAINEVLSGQDCIGNPAALKTSAKNTLVAAINEVLSGQDCIGSTNTLKTNAKNTLVAAVNEVLGNLNHHIQDNVAITADGAQLLVNILGQGRYLTDQTENLEALAGMLGVESPVEKENLILHWDFQSGSLVDLVAGVEAVSENVTLDDAGAHTHSAGSYITLPLGLDGAPLGDNVLEIKFGETAMTDIGNMRLAMICDGTQPASIGMLWNARKCWASGLFDTTELTDLNMFSGKTLIGRTGSEGQGIDWYLDGQLLCSPKATVYIPTHVSLGSSASAAYPYTVEYVKIRPGS